MASGAHLACVWASVSTAARRTTACSCAPMSRSCPVAGVSRQAASAVRRARSCALPSAQQRQEIDGFVQEWSA